MNKTRAKTDEWIARLSLLDTEAGEAGDSVRIKCALRIADFRVALEAFQAKMKKLEESDDRKWEEQRADAENAFSALEESFDRVCGDIKKTIRGNSSLDESNVPRDEDAWDH
ncbi:MAG: hypothetical protein EHM54_10140 [Nitrospiraceae bacterium]|nr:MAG: hypothetical protein EHM54_10140 [Nitrospiraceae bacterium]